AGRDPRAIKRSVNMALLITSRKDEVDGLAAAITKRLGAHAADASDLCLAGTPSQIRDKLYELKAAGADTIFIPTMFRPLNDIRRDMDQLMSEIAPEFRS